MLTLSLGLFAFVVQVFVTSAATSPCISELAYQNIFSSPLQQYTSSDFNVICFGNFDSEGGGDLEGRAAVLGSVTFESGFSVGYAIHSAGPNATDAVRPWSLVVGGDLSWANGALYPEGNNNPYPAPEEGMFIGGTVTAPSYLASRQSGGPCQGCLNTAFQTAYKYYSELSSNFSATPPNAGYNFQNNGIFLYSSDMFTSRYYLQIEVGIFNEATYWSTSNMNPAADFIVTLIGNDGTDIIFSGGNFPGIPSQTVFNVPGKRTIDATNAVTGHLLAPDSTLLQPNGNLVGFVIVNEVKQFLDSYKPNCPSEICCQYCPPNRNLIIDDY